MGGGGGGSTKKTKTNFKSQRWLPFFSVFFNQFFFTKNYEITNNTFNSSANTLVFFVV